MPSPHVDGLALGELDGDCEGLLDGPELGDAEGEVLGLAVHGCIRPGSLFVVPLAHGVQSATFWAPVVLAHVPAAHGNGAARPAAGQ